MPETLTRDPTPVLKRDPAGSTPTLTRDETPVTPGGALSAFGKGAWHGVGNIVTGAEQLVSHLDPFQGVFPKAKETADKWAQERETAYQQDPTIRAHPVASTIGEIGGEIVGTAPLDFIPGMATVNAVTRLGRYGRAAIKGAEIGGLEPVTGGKDDYWTEKMKQSGLGAAGGAVGERVFGRAGSLIAPQVDPDVSALAAQGVRMTPGQLATGRGGVASAVARRGEEILKNWPILGDYIRKGQTGSISDFNLATLNQIADVVGTRLPEGIEAGHPANRFVNNAVENAFTRALAPLVFTPDQQLIGALGNLFRLSSNMGPQANQFQSILTNTIFHRLGVQPNEVADFLAGTLNRPINMDGRSLQIVLNDLRMSIDRFSGPMITGSERELGSGLRQAREELLDSLERQNPTASADLKNARLAYAMLSRVRDAVGGRGADPSGVFRPTDLYAAARGTGRNRQKTAFMNGDKLMQAWAAAGQRILPGKMPDSGTPERLGWLRAIGRLLSHPTLAVPALATTGHMTGTTLPLMVGTALGMLPYTPWGMRAAQAYAIPGATRSFLRQPISDISSYIGDPALAAMFAGQPQAPKQ